MARSFDLQILTIGDGRELTTPVHGLANIFGAMYYQDRCVEVSAGVDERLPIRKVELDSLLGGNEDLSARLEGPGDSVLVMLGRMPLD
jgi:hypothetical protein